MGIENFHDFEHIIREAFNKKCMVWKLQEPLTLLWEDYSQNYPCFSPMPSFVPADTSLPCQTSSSVLIKMEFIHFLGCPKDLNFIASA